MDKKVKKASANVAKEQTMIIRLNGTGANGLPMYFERKVVGANLSASQIIGSVVDAMRKEVNKGRKLFRSGSPLHVVVSVDEKTINVSNFCEMGQFLQYSPRPSGWLKLINSLIFAFDAAISANKLEKAIDAESLAKEVQKDVDNKVNQIDLVNATRSKIVKGLKTLDVSKVAKIGELSNITAQKAAYIASQKDRKTQSLQRIEAKIKVCTNNEELEKLMLRKAKIENSIEGYEMDQLDLFIAAN